MKKLLGCTILAVGTAVAIPAAAAEVTLSMHDGRVTLVAQNASVGQILAEWARIGQTTIVNGDKLVGPPVSLRLVNVPEKDALDVLLRSASGYLAAPRPIGDAGSSAYDRIMILPTSHAPAMAVSAPPPAYPRAMPTEMMPVDDDEGDLVEAPVVTPPGVPPPGMDPQGMPANPAMSPYPGAPLSPYPGAPQPDPGDEPIPEGAAGQPMPVLTSPRPGMLPQPQMAPGTPGAPSPLQPQPGKPGGGPGGPGGR